MKMRTTKGKKVEYPKWWDMSKIGKENYTLNHI